MLRKVFFLLVLATVSLLSNNSKAGTLNWGVSIGSFHVAGGAQNSNPITDQLKYYIAVDHKIGIKEKYKVEQITNTYQFSTYSFSSDTYDYSTTYDDSYNTAVKIDAGFEGGDKNELYVNTISN